MNRTLPRLSVVVGLLLWSSAILGESPPPDDRRREVTVAIASGSTALEGADLSGFDFSGLTLEGAKLTGANLSGALFTGVNLKSANLTGANLAGATLEGADLSLADLSHANLDGARLGNALLLAAKLDGTHMDSGTDFRPKSFNGATFSGAILDGVRVNVAGGSVNMLAMKSLTFDNASMKGAAIAGGIDKASFKGADLTDATFAPGASYRGVAFDNAKLMRTKFTGVTFGRCVSFVGADLTDANLEGAKVDLTKLITDGECKSSGLALNHATLVGASLRGVSLRGVSFAGSDLSGAELGASDLTDAVFAADTNVAGAKLQGAKGVQANRSLGLSKNIDAAVLDDHATRGSIMLIQVKALAGGTSPLVEDADWHGSDLSGIQFKGFTLRRVNLAGTNLFHASFEGAVLEDVDLTGSTSTPAASEKAFGPVANFDGARLSGVKLGGVQFWLDSARRQRGSATAKGTTIKTNFADGEVFDPDVFTGADYTGSQFVGVTLANTPTCHGCDLSRVVFKQHVMLDKRVSGSSFNGATFSRGVSLTCSHNQPGDAWALDGVQIQSPDVYNGLRVDGQSCMSINCRPAQCNLAVTHSTVANLMLTGSVGALKLTESTVAGGRANDGDRSRPHGATCTQCDFASTTFSHFDFSLLSFAGTDLTGMRLDGSTGFPGAVTGLDTVTGMESVTGY